MLIVGADSAVCPPDFAVFQVFIFIKWLCNKIGCRFNIKFLPNIWTQTRKSAFLGCKVDVRTVLTVVNAIFGARLPDFGEMQVSVCIKWICNNIYNIYNKQNWQNFWNNTKIGTVLLIIKTCAHTDWLWMMLWLKNGHQNLHPDRYVCIKCLGATTFNIILTEKIFTAMFVDAKFTYLIHIFAHRYLCKKKFWGRVCPPNCTAGLLL